MKARDYRFTFLDKEGNELYTRDFKGYFSHIFEARAHAERLLADLCDDTRKIKVNRIY